MARLVWFLVLALAVIALVRALRRRSVKHDPATRPPPPAGAAPDRTPQVMVRCAHCDMHLAAADALRDGNHFYCSPAHRDGGPAPTPRP